MEGREQTVGAAATAEGARPGDVHDVLSLWKNAGADDALRERAPPPPPIFREEDKTRINAMKDAGKKKTAALELAAAGFMDKQFKSKAAAAGAYRTEFAVEVTGRRIGQVVQQLEAAKRKLRAARGTTRPKMPPATSLVGGARKRRRGRANIPRGLPPRSRRLGQDATSHGCVPMAAPAHQRRGHRRKQSTCRQKGRKGRRGGGEPYSTSCEGSVCKRAFIVISDGSDGGAGIGRQRRVEAHGTPPFSTHPFQGV